MDIQIICKWIVFSFLNELELICLHSCILIVSTQLNSLNYFYETLIIQFDINHLFEDNEEVTSFTI